MVFFYEDKNVKVEFRVVFAFPTPVHVQDEHGIYYNFSAKTIIHAKGVEIPIVSLNQLSIVTSKDGVEYISSMCTYPKKKDLRTGEIILGKRIDSATMFPGHRNSGVETQRYDDFMEQLLKEIDTFIQKKRAEVRLPREISSRLASLSTLKTEGGETSQRHDNVSDYGEIPF